MSITSAIAGVTPVNIYTVLQGEHREIDIMLKTMENIPEALEGSRESMLERLRDELLSHAHAEQMTVYRLLKERSPDKDGVQHATYEHEQIEQLIDELLTTDPQSGEWGELVYALKTTVRHHVEEEESTLFDDLKEILNEDEARELAKDFLKAKDREAEKLHA